MEQFNLDKWLQDKSLKVVTRDGRPVRIVCWDAKMECPIIALALNKYNNKEIPLHYRVDGTYSEVMESDVDLFFADEEEKLTEFEKMFRYVLECYSGHEYASKSEIETLKLNAKSLLDLARKELQPEFAKEMDKMLAETDKVVYQKGQQDILKSLPKWKKATENKDFDRHVLLFEAEDRVVLTTEINEDEYYIELDDLKTLPK